MSVWTTKALNSNKNYIVIKHSLPNINSSINGVKFRGGYAVVEKDSKTYYNLKKLPMLKNAEEFPLSHLKDLKFITRTADVKMVYGLEVYHHYATELAAKLEKERQEQRKIEEENHITVENKCRYRLASNYDNKLCELEALDVTPSKFCKVHLLEDPKLIELGFKIPVAMTKEQRKKFKEKVIEELEEMNKAGLING